MTCPVCGAQATIVEGGYISLMGFGRRVSRAEARDLPLGQIGTEWYGFERESDRVVWPEGCPGYSIRVTGDGTVETAHLMSWSAVDRTDQ